MPDEGIELRLLSSANVKDIHDLYPAGDIESIEVFEKLIDRLPGCGIFIRSTGELVAWMVCIFILIFDLFIAEWQMTNLLDLDKFLTYANIFDSCQSFLESYCLGENSFKHPAKYSEKLKIFGIR